MSLQMMAGVGIVVLMLLALMFRKASAPQVQFTPQRKQGIGLGLWILIILAALLFFSQLPWLLTHLPIHNVPVQVSASHTSATAVASPPALGTRAYYIWYARQAATAVHINPDVFVRQIAVESDFNPSAVSRAGAIGIAQFMESTARAWGVDPYDPERSLNGAARLMAHLLSVYHNSYAQALGAYNAGEGAINAAIKRGGASWQAYIPLETRRYIAAILQGMQL
jgi:soluble lytic murein transglycosylase-like protein